MKCFSLQNPPPNKATEQRMVGDKTTTFFTTNIQNYNRRVSMYILQIHIMQFMSEKRDEEDQTITKKMF